MKSVPFTTKDPKTKGEVWPDGEKLIFTFSHPEKVEASLPYKALKTVSLKPALVFGGASVRLRLREAGDVSPIPQESADLIVLRFKKKHVELAEELHKEVQFSLMEHSVDDLLDLMG